MNSTKWLGGSGSWTTASAWSSGIPATTTEALFQTGASAPYTVSGGGAAGSIGVVGDQVDLTGTVSTAGAAAGFPTSPLDATVSGGGMLTITGTFADGGGIVGYLTPGAVSVSGAGATWNTGIVTVGAAANGTLSISNGALVFDYEGGLDNGTVSISGAGSTWQNVDDLVDYPGLGPTNLFVTNGGTLIGGGIFAAQATLSIDDTAVLTTGLLMAENGSVIQAINPAGQTSSAPAVLGLNLQLQSESVMPVQAGQFASAAGTALVLTGTVAPGTGYRVLETGPGTVFLTSTTGMSRGGTNIDGGTLVLAGPGAAGGAPVQFTGGGVLVIGTAGPAGVVTVGGDAAPDTVFAGSGALIGGIGKMTVINGNGASTVDGSNVAGGANTVFGGVGGGFFQSSALPGANLLVAGTGAATLEGSATGTQYNLDPTVQDQLYANGTASDMLLAGGGSETLSGSGASGNNLYVGSTGSDLIVAGAGSDTVTAGTGLQTIFGGSGSTTIRQTGGSETIIGGSGADTMLPGSGNATVYGGIGADLYDVVAGQAGGTEIIFNFRPGTDLVRLTGYAQGAGATALQTALVTGGSTIVTLSDQSRLVFVGISNLPRSAFG